MCDSVNSLQTDVDKGKYFDGGLGLAQRHTYNTWTSEFGAVTKLSVVFFIYLSVTLQKSSLTVFFFLPFCFSPSAKTFTVKEETSWINIHLLAKQMMDFIASLIFSI